MIENIKARFNCVRFNIWTNKVDENNKEGYYLYNNTIYYGHPLFVFFQFAQNSWYKANKNELQK